MKVANATKQCSGLAIGNKKSASFLWMRYEILFRKRLTINVRDVLLRKRKAN